MGWLYQISIRTMLKIIMGIIAFFLILSSVNMYMNASEMGKKLEVQSKETIPQAINYITLKIDVIQIQQWLTDISATRGAKGYDDGFKEAENYYQSGRNEKNGRLKTSENFATMRVCKRFFKMDCKKAPRSAQIVKI